MIAFWKKAGLGIAVVGVFVLGAVLVLWVFRPPKVPVPVKQTVVEQAAQHAAAAIVTVERTDTALAHHVAAKRTVRAILTAPLPVGVDSQTAETQRLVAVDSVLTQDNEQLATQLEATRGVLAPDTLARIPQDSAPAPPRIHLPSLGTKIGSALLSAITPTVGYGAVYDGRTITLGPSITIGLHLTSGRIGVTAGVSAGYAGHAVHVGLGLNLGVRL